MSIFHGLFTSRAKNPTKELRPEQGKDFMGSSLFYFKFVKIILNSKFAINLSCFCYICPPIKKADCFMTTFDCDRMMDILSSKEFKATTKFPDFLVCRVTILKN